MRELGRELRNRQQGGASVKLIVWVLIGFGAYSAYSFFPATMARSQLEGAVQNVLDHGNHNLADAAILNKALRAAASMKIPLTEDDIRIRHERADGERTLHVEFEFPFGVSYLGSERSVMRQVHAEKTFKVNEAEEARLLAQHEEQMRQNEEGEWRHQLAKADYVSNLKEECTKANSKDFYTTHLSVTHGNDETQLIDCSAIARW